MARARDLVAGGFGHVDRHSRVALDERLSSPSVSKGYLIWELMYTPFLTATFITYKSYEPLTTSVRIYLCLPPSTC
jgi:hypothetical protein